MERARFLSQPASETFVLLVVGFSGGSSVGVGGDNFVGGEDPPSDTAGVQYGRDSAAWLRRPHMTGVERPNDLLGPEAVDTCEPGGRGDVAGADDDPFTVVRQDAQRRSLGAGAAGETARAICDLGHPPGGGGVMWSIGVRREEVPAGRLHGIADGVHDERGRVDYRRTHGLGVSECDE